MRRNVSARIHYVDSDKIRSVYQLSDYYSYEQEVEVCRRCVEIAAYELTLNDIILISASFPEAANRPEKINGHGVMWVKLIGANKSDRVDIELEDGQFDLNVFVDKKSAEKICDEVVGAYRAKTRQPKL